MSSGLVIINPVAGRGRGERLRTRVRAGLDRFVPNLEFVETRHPGHATELARSSGHGLIVAVGGDGTAREVAVGLVDRPDRPEFALIPVGSGNDLARNLGIPTRLETACAVVATGRAHPVDMVRLSSGDNCALFVNAAGFGFDARVIAEARRFRHLRGMPLYLAAVMRAVRTVNCPRARITVGARTMPATTGSGLRGTSAPVIHEQLVLLVAAANGRCYGGGMKIAPRAEPDDGEMEVCVIGAVSRMRLLRCLPELIRGTHGALPEVWFASSPALGLEFTEPVPIQLDGDLIDWPGARQFRLDVLPGAVRVRVPDR